KHLARRNEIAFVNEDFPDPAGAPRRDVNFDGLNASIPAGDPCRQADVCISFPSIVAGHGQNEGESRRQPPLYDRLHWCRTLWRASGWTRLCYSSRRIADRLSKIDILCRRQLELFFQLLSRHQSADDGREPFGSAEEIDILGDDRRIGDAGNDRALGRRLLKSS